MTHNQVAYWDMVRSNAAREEANRIADYEAAGNLRLNAFKAGREEYWTHKNYNWNESMFGYQLFKDLGGMIMMAALA